MQSSVTGGVVALARMGQEVFEVSGMAEVEGLGGVEVVLFEMVSFSGLFLFFGRSSMRGFCTRVPSSRPVHLPQRPLQWPGA